MDANHGWYFFGGFLCGAASVILLGLVYWIGSLFAPEPIVTKCPHGDDWDNCPDCCH